MTKSANKKRKKQTQKAFFYLLLSRQKKIEMSGCLFRSQHFAALRNIMHSVKQMTNYAKLFKNHPFRTELLRDPILCALMTRSITWGDLATEDEPVIKPVTITPIITKPIITQPIITQRIQKQTPYVTWEVPTVMHIMQPMQPMQPMTKENPEADFTPVKSVKRASQVKESSIKTIIVNNIPRNSTKEGIIDIFREFGAISGAHLPKNTDQNSPYFGTLRGFAMIQFIDARDAQKAYTMCSHDPFYVGDLPVSVQIAKEDRVIYTVKQ